MVQNSEPCQWFIFPHTLHLLPHVEQSTFFGTLDCEQNLYWSFGGWMSFLSSDEDPVDSFRLALFLCILFYRGAFWGLADIKTLLHVELSFLKLPFPGLLILDPKKYSVSKRRVAHRRTGTEVTCFRPIPKASQISIEGFAIFLVPLVRF